MERRKLGALIGRYILILIFLLWTLFPIYWMIITSLKSPKDIYSGFYFFPGIDYHVSYIGWKWIFGPGLRNSLLALRNSFLFAFCSSLFGLVIGSLAAYGLARYKYKFLWMKTSEDVLFFVVSQRMMPPIVSILGLYYLFRTIGLLDTAMGMIILYTWMNVPLIVFLLKDFFVSIPVEIEQAAAVDGYTRLQQFFKIVLPSAKSGLAAVFLLSFVFAWNEFLGALFFTMQRTQTLSVLIAGMNTQQEPLWWTISAIGTIAIIPPVIVTIALNKYLAGGLFFGGAR
ncbi:MetI-like domain [Moorella glycerini]|uniref:Inner membrane ABC transporter permease protein YcjP n=1 Tax=Neomoorella stamsii TaxID=1266720 RepID=A0A9X7J569_9FIRM|nr:MULTISPECIES: carbohydrate ABC transporter permease [Moorella]PRR76251.1 Inner membrane ABC transporter permease protein YcjP [Moorella stamsii]CEP66561.1 MetI-like domain [Moorella glycerini]